MEGTIVLILKISDEPTEFIGPATRERGRDESIEYRVVEDFRRPWSQRIERMSFRGRH